MAGKPTTTSRSATAAKTNDAQTSTNEAAAEDTSNETVATKQRIALQKIILHRGGKRIIVKYGQKFAFTPDELKGLKGAVREPINENQTAEEVVFEPVVPLQNIAQASSDTNVDQEEL